MTRMTDKERRLNLLRGDLRRKLEDDQPPSAAPTRCDNANPQRQGAVVSQPFDPECPSNSGIHQRRQVDIVDRIGRELLERPRGSAPLLCEILIVAKQEIERLRDEQPTLGAMVQRVLSAEQERDAAIARADEAEAQRDALREALDVPAPGADSCHWPAVEALCGEIGYGVVVSTAAALWRGIAPGGEFHVGPCQATVDAALSDTTDAAAARDARIRLAERERCADLCDNHGTIDGDLLGYAIRALEGK